MAALLDQLRPGDALALADRNPELRDALIDGFLIPRCQFDTKTILIAHQSINSNPDQHIKIESIDVILRFLRVFGDEVRNIEFRGDRYTYQDMHTISEHIVAYCSDSLVSIRISNAADYLLSETHSLFPNVLNVDVAFVGRGLESLNFSQIYRIFPSVENLVIAPYVKPFYLATSKFGQQIRSLLPLIPQLRSLRVSSIAANAFLRTIEQFSINLEELDIEYDTNVPITNTIHLKSVKNLTLVMKSGKKIIDQMSPFRIDRLEKLEILSTDSQYVPMQLIADSNHLKSFSLPWTHSDYDVDQIVDMLYAKKHLEHVTLHWSLGAREAAHTLSTIANFHQLTKLTFVVFEEHGSMSQVDAFRSVEHSDWVILSIMSRSLYTHVEYHITVIPTSKIHLFLPRN